MLLCSLNVFVLVVLVGRMVFSCPSTPKRPPHIKHRRPKPVTPKPRKVPPVSGRTIRVIRNNNITLPCNVSITVPGVDDSKPGSWEVFPDTIRWYRVRWYKDGVCKTDHEFKNVTKQPHEFPGLPIIYVNHENRGAYICRAETVREKKNATTINLVVAGECSHGTYGKHCEHECGFCANGKTCNTTTGRCLKCKKGWILPFCWLRDPNSCEKGTYGPVCGDLCGHCAGNATCNATNGHCKKGCEQGWEPPLCQMRKGKTKSGGGSLALSVSMGAPAILGAVAAVLQLFKWMSDGLPCLSGFGDEEQEEEEEQREKQLLQQQIIQKQLMIQAGANLENVEEDEEEIEEEEAGSSSKQEDSDAMLGPSKSESFDQGKDSK